MGPCQGNYDSDTEGARRAGRELCSGFAQPGHQHPGAVRAATPGTVPAPAAICGRLNNGK